MEAVQTTSTNTKETEPLTLEDLQRVFSMLPEGKEPPYQLVIFACVKHSKELKRRIAESSKDANPLIEPSVMIHVKKYLKKVRLVKIPVGFSYGYNSSFKGL